MKYYAIIIWNENGEEQWDRASLIAHKERCEATKDLERALSAWRVNDIESYWSMKVTGKVISENKYHELIKTEL